MRHYLLTRFNVRVPEWRGVDKSGVRVLDDAWMQHRFALFDKHTVPSVRGQTCQEFLWLVLFDVATSRRWLRRIKNYTEFLPLFLTENYLKELQAFLSYDPMTWLVTTRLDNDDALEPTFMETLHEYFRGRKAQRCFINIPNGWILRDGILEPSHHRANPFITYMERESQTVFFTPHSSKMGEICPLRQVGKRRLWTQVIHERNYVNE